MARFRFRLQRVLDIRHRQEEAARNELALLNRRLVEEEEKKKRLEQALTEADDRFLLRHKEGTVGINDLKILQNYRERLAHDIRLQETIIQLARERVRAAMEAVVEATKRRRVLERLRERHYQDHLVEEGRIEQRELDEQGGNITRRKKDEELESLEERRVGNYAG